MAADVGFKGEIMSERKILQMMPAQGWVARFAEADGEYLSPLVGWALVQGGNGTSIAGLVAGDKTVEMCDDDADFLGYAYLPDALEDMLDDFDDDDFEDEDEDEDDDEPPRLPRRPTRLN
jgi:hypothetical protein